MNRVLTFNQDLPLDLGQYRAYGSSKDDRRAAAALQAALQTCVPRTPLRSHGEQELAALRGLRRIIPRLSKLMARYPNARRFEYVAVNFLHHLLRPRLTRWQSWVASDNFDDDRRRAFRDELETFKPALDRVGALLEKVRQRKELVPDDLFMGVPMASMGLNRIRSRKALEPIKAGLEGEFPNCVPVFEAEKPEIEARNHGSLDNVAGLALSGGGIRSATFSLGVVEVLAKRGLFPKIGYLSTVSGGGYLGTFLSSYLHEPGKLENEERAINKVFDRDSRTDTGPVRHLRNRSKFLLDGGFKLKLRALSMMVFGIIINLIALLPFVALAVLLVWLLKEFNYWGDSWWSVPAEGNWLDTKSGAVRVFYIFGVAALFVQIAVRQAVAFISLRSEPGTFRGKLRRRFRGDANRMSDADFLTFLALILGILAVVPVFFLGFTALRSTVSDLENSQWALLAAAAGALIPMVSGPLAIRFKGRQIVGPLLRLLFMLSGSVFFLIIFLILGDWVIGLEWHWAFRILVFVGIFLVQLILFWMMDLNDLSPHQIYRNQLAKCYLVRGREAAGEGTDRTGVIPIERLKLSHLCLKRRTDSKELGPYHLLNATVNLPGSENKELRGRRGDFFLFSPHYCGSPTTDYATTSALEERDPCFDLGSAMAVSGAAFSSNMGATNLEQYRFFLTLLNVRLGYWIANCVNPGWIVKWTKKRLKHSCTPGPDCLLREMLGTMTENHSFFNISDGGHIENLGVYELLRRRCKYVISVDGECDSGMVFDGLIKLIRYARIDFGAEIVIDTSPLAKDDDGLSSSHSVMGKVLYADGSIGWLLYIKLSLTGNEAPDVLDYRRAQPVFPHESTLDQIYSEQQFESYHALGKHAAEDLFQLEILRSAGDRFAAFSESGNTDLPDWFEALAMNLLPDNDEVFQADPTNLDDMKVGISVSEPKNTDRELINSPTWQLSKKLIELGASVVFGHDWRSKGVMTAIAELALEDKLLHGRKKEEVIFNRVPVLKNRESTPPPDNLKELRKVVDYRKLADSGDDWKNLCALRAELTELSDARICLGGKTSGFTGLIPGVMHEAILAARAGQPVLISGCLNGASAYMANRLNENKSVGEPPHYNEEGKDLGGLPPTCDALIEELKKAFHASPQLDLHRRLWRTTTLDAALAVMIEILDLHENVATPKPKNEPVEGGE